MPAAAWLGTALLVAAALGGVFLNLMFHTKLRPLPKPIVVVHGVLAVAGVALLATFRRHGLSGEPILGAGDLLRSCVMTAPHVPQIRLYQDWLRDSRGLSFDSYDALWRWSVTDLAAFWQSIWDYFELQSPTPHKAVLAERKMPGAKWFEGAQFNYVRQVFRHVDEAACAPACRPIVSRNEKGERSAS